MSRSRKPGSRKPAEPSIASPQAAEELGAEQTSPEQTIADGALRREIGAASLSRRREIAVDERADPDERADVVRTLELASLETLFLRGAMAPQGARGWRFEGEIEARLEQICVATLEPVPAEIREPVERIWLPADELAALEAERAEEIGVNDLDSLDLDIEEPELLADAIDLGAVAIEALALALDPYPRAPDAEPADILAGPPGVAPMTDDDAKPFAGLAELKIHLETVDGDDPDDDQAN